MDYIESYGVQIPYYVNGEGFPLFIFNGFTCSQPNLKYLIADLSKKYKVISWDYVGHGKSGTPADFSEISVDSFADDAAKIMDRLKVEKAVFLGYSLGAQVMLQNYLENRNRAEVLISLCGFPGNAFDSFLHSPLSANVVELLNNVAPKISDPLRNIWKTVMHLPFPLRFVGASLFINREKVKREDVEPFFNSMAHLDPNLLIHISEKMRTHSVADSLHSIDIPTLVIGGEKDLFAPFSRSKEIHRLIDGSELVMIPGASHNANLEEPEFILKRVHDFLDRKLNIK